MKKPNKLYTDSNIYTDFISSNKTRHNKLESNKLEKLNQSAQAKLKPSQQTEPEEPAFGLQTGPDDEPVEQQIEPEEPAVSLQTGSDDEPVEQQTEPEELAVGLQTGSDDEPVEQQTSIPSLAWKNERF